MSFPQLGQPDTGDTAWMLASSALVLLMTPGLAFFYGGMVRTRSVLNMIAEGFTNRAIGQKLFITESTVEKHVAAIFQKLGLPSQQASHFDRRVRAVWLYLRSHHLRPTATTDSA